MVGLISIGSGIGDQGSLFNCGNPNVVKPVFPVVEIHFDILEWSVQTILNPPHQKTGRITMRTFPR